MPGRRPLVSVVIPTFNRASLLLRAIRSVEEQIFTDWEVVVIDDGSTDDTAQLFSTGAFPKVRYFRQENQGVGVARNHGIAEARGYFVAMLDSDDEYLPDHLKTRMRLMQEEEPPLDLVAGGFEIRGSSETVVDFFDSTKLVDLRSCIVGGSLVGRREVFVNLGGFNQDAYGEDTDFWQRAQKAFRTRLLDGPRTYVLHETPGSLRDIRMTQFRNPS
jgi:glycosyltransferase involved in cell wall biosynthesis